MSKYDWQIFFIILSLIIFVGSMFLIMAINEQPEPQPVTGVVIEAYELGYERAKWEFIDKCTAETQSPMQCEHLFKQGINNYLNDQ